MPEGAQPAPESTDTGQGTEGQDAGLYGDFLDGVPEDLHGTLTERLKAKDADFTKQQQKVAGQWQPYDELGVRDVDPEELGSYLNLGNALQAAAGGDEEAKAAIQEWWQEIGNNLGFGAKPEEPEASDLLDLTPEKLQEMVGKQVTDAINPLTQQLEQAEQERLQGEAEQEISDQLAAIRKENPNLSDEDERRILAFAYMFGQDSEDPISAGLEEFKQVAAGGENGLFEQKLHQPAPAEGAGRADTSPPRIDSFADAEKSANERLRQAAAT